MYRGNKEVQNKDNGEETNDVLSIKRTKSNHTTKVNKQHSITVAIYIINHPHIIHQTVHKYFSSNTFIFNSHFPY